MSTRAKETLRVFGGLHIAMALLGLVLVVVRTARVPRNVGSAANASQFVAFLVAETAISVLCLLLLGAAGVALLRCDPRGVRLSNVVLPLEFIWAFGVAAAHCGLFEAGERWISLGVSYVIAGGVSGLSPQVLTGYPFIALVAINLANRSRRRVGGDKFSPARPADGLPPPGAAVTSAGELPLGGVRQDTGSWARRILRVFGALHIIMVVIGVMAATGYALLLPEPPKGLALRPAPPHFLMFFFAVATVSLLCLYLLGTAGIALVRGDPRGVGRSNLALLLEVVWFNAVILACEVMGVAGGPWRSLGVSERIEAALKGNLALSPQVGTGYALVALIAVNLANRRLRRISR